MKHRNGKKADNLNELEYVDGFIYSNVWYENNILKIDANTGLVVEVFDLSSLWPMRERVSTSADCLNGIAYDKAKEAFYLTGKLWPKYYLVKFE